MSGLPVRPLTFFFYNLLRNHGIDRWHTVGFARDYGLARQGRHG